MIPVLLLLALGGLMQAARSFTTDTSIAGTELAFGFMLLAAYFTAKIVNRFGLPKLSGYLISGVIVGEFVLGFVSHDMTETLKVVSDTATAIIALEAGSELQLKAIKPLLKTLNGITLLAVIGSMFTIGGALFLMRPLLPDIFGQFDLVPSLVVCLAIGTALSAQSPAVVMAMLSELRAEGPLSRMILASVVVADLTVITIFSVVLAITSAVIGGNIDVVGTAVEVLWELIGSMAFGLVIGMLVGRYLLYVKGGSALFALMVCVVVAEIAPTVHLDVLIVMLATGIWLRNFSKADATALLHKFEAAQLPVFLVFFALAGSHLNIYKLFAAIIPVVIIAVTRATTFFVGAKVACRITHAEPMVTKYAWFGLVPQAGLALALATVLRTNFQSSFGNGAATILLGVVGFNECVAPVILRFMLIRSGEAGKKQGADFAAGGH
ncbi:MAG TPA: cation:proton antiporter [Kofleriaceae bacterium]|nr:cation:proton antiporter [Kofleriaceae bacterium]